MKKERREINKQQKNGIGTKILVILNLILLAIIAFLVIFYYTNNPKIAYVKSSHLIAQYQGFIDATQAYQGKNSLWQANIDTLRNELQQEIEELEASKPNMTVKEVTLSEELITNKQRQFMQYQQAIQQKAQEEDQSMSNKVLEEVNAFLKEYGKKHNYTIIFGATEVGNVIYAKGTIDITEQVLGELNRSYANN